MSRIIADSTPRLEPVLGTRGSVAPEHFDQLYGLHADPWDFETSSYEAQKYAASLACLLHPLYANALELGCSIGVLTQLLATRCRQLLATGVSARALARTRERCADQNNVRCEPCELPDHYPQGEFDLIVLSEVGYYFSKLDLECLRKTIAASLATQGHLLLVHYTGDTSYPQTAAAVHHSFHAWPERPWKSLFQRKEEDYLLELFEKH